MYPLRRAHQDDERRAQPESIREGTDVESCCRRAVGIRDHSPPPSGTPTSQEDAVGSAIDGGSEEESNSSAELRDWNTRKKASMGAFERSCPETPTAQGPVSNRVSKHPTNQIAPASVTSFTATTARTAAGTAADYRAATWTPSRPAEDSAQRLILDIHTTPPSFENPAQSGHAQQGSGAGLRPISVAPTAGFGPHQRPGSAAPCSSPSPDPPYRQPLRAPALQYLDGTTPSARMPTPQASARQRLRRRVIPSPGCPNDRPAKVGVNPPLPIKWPLLGGFAFLSASLRCLLQGFERGAHRSVERLIPPARERGRMPQRQAALCALPQATLTPAPGD